MSYGVHQVGRGSECKNKADLSLSNRIHAGLGDATSAHGRLIVEDRPVADASLSVLQNPSEELWALQVALRKVRLKGDSSGSCSDLQGEPTHIALRRTQLSLARYEATRPKLEDKHSRGWAAEHAFDEAAWHGSQAALWAMMGVYIGCYPHQADNRIEHSCRAARRYGLWKRYPSDRCTATACHCQGPAGEADIFNMD